MQYYQVWEYGGMICASYFLLSSLFLDKSPLQFTAETSLCTSKWPHIVLINVLVLNCWSLEKFTFIVHALPMFAHNQFLFRDQSLVTLSGTQGWQSSISSIMKGQSLKPSPIFQRIHWFCCFPVLGWNAASVVLFPFQHHSYVDTPQSSLLRWRLSLTFYYTRLLLNFYTLQSSKFLLSCPGPKDNTSSSRSTALMLLSYDSYAPLRPFFIFHMDSILQFGYILLDRVCLPPLSPKIV